MLDAFTVILKWLVLISRKQGQSISLSPRHATSVSRFLSEN